MQNADDIALRAKIRHQSLMARRERLEAVQRDLATWRADLRSIATRHQAELHALAARGSEIAGRLSTAMQELDQQETTIRLPTLPDPDHRTAPTDRIDRRPR